MHVQNHMDMLKGLLSKYPGGELKFSLQILNLAEGSDPDLELFEILAANHGFEFVGGQYRFKGNAEAIHEEAVAFLSAYALQQGIQTGSTHLKSTIAQKVMAVQRAHELGMDFNSYILSLIAADIGDGFPEHERKPGRGPGNAGNRGKVGNPWGRAGKPEGR